MVKKIAIAVAVLIGAFFGFVLIQPATYHVERTLTVDAPVDVVFPLINDMKARAVWYPWDRLDPDMKRTYSEMHVGKGAWYEWSGNDKVGTGRQEILESVKHERVVDDLHFMTPFDSRNKATFVLKPAGDKTEVTWSIDGGDGFSTKLAGVFMNMDDAVGPDFEKGLGFLNEVASKQAKAPVGDAAGDTAAVDDAAVDDAAGDKAAVEGSDVGPADD